MVYFQIKVGVTVGVNPTNENADLKPTNGVVFKFSKCSPAAPSACDGAAVEF